MRISLLVAHHQDRPILHGTQGAAVAVGADLLLPAGFPVENMGIFPQEASLDVR